MTLGARIKHAVPVKQERFDLLQTTRELTRAGHKCPTEFREGCGNLGGVHDRAYR